MIREAWSRWVSFTLLDATVAWASVPDTGSVMPAGDTRLGIRMIVRRGSTARIRSFGPSNQSLRVHPTEVDCEFGLSMTAR
jgi:hypothetical protein